MKTAVSRWLATICLLGLIVIFAQHYSAQEYGDDGVLRLWFFDVGQGDAIMIDTPQHQQILVDGGPSEVVLSRLAKALPLSDKELDLLIITHNHSDHLTGVNAILQHYKVNQIWLTGAIHTTETFRRTLQIINDQHIPTKTVRAGEMVSYGDLSGIIIYPLEDLTGQAPEDQNTASIVSYWQYGQISWLLTGDLPAAQEGELLQRGLVKQATILKVAHQGSKNSSAEEFLRAVRPEVSVIFAGKNNQFGHPHQTTLEHLRQIGTKIFRTDQDRTILVSVWPESYQVKTHQ